MSKFSAPIAKTIWDMKYRLKTNLGEPVDITVEDTWERIATALAEAEGGNVRAKWKDDFRRVLEDFAFLPAGRITAGAGSGRRVTLSNCFTMGTIPDSMDGIFTHLREAALTMQQGGGIGYDFSPIRPKSSAVKKLGADASGPLSFMDVWDAMCRTVMSAGSRRGAMMATMRCDHPDVEDFITAKHDKARLRMFNLSVLITDEFMGAVARDENWHLVHKEPPMIALDEFEGVCDLTGDRASERLDHQFVHKVVKAKVLWNKIIRSTYDFAEPGVIFIDRVNEAHNLRYLEKIATTNPCGEKPMGPYASCLLGSVNLATMIVDAFRSGAYLDHGKLRATVRTAIRMMDNVIDVGGFPLESQKAKAQQDRQLGLGVTGLADALIMMGVRYGSVRAVQLTNSWMKIIDETAYLASVDLAKEKGSFPTFNAEEFLADGTHASQHNDEIKDAIREFGIRNSLLTSIAPTGTISIYAGNVSSGIEPVFALAYIRKVLQKDGTRTEELVEDYAVAEYRKFWYANRVEPHGYPDEAFDIEKHLPEYFVTAQNLTPEDHVAMQAAAQRWVDSSISKTINCPEDITFEDFEDVYLTAYNSGCKGCTTYRPNDVTGSVLSVVETPKVEAEGQIVDDPDGPENEAHFEINYSEELPRRPEALTGATYKIKVGDKKAVYLTVSDIEENGVVRPYEIFLRSSDPTNDEWMVALSRMVSALMRRPHAADFVPEELRRIHSATTGGFWGARGYQPSIVAAIGTKLREHMNVGGPSATIKMQPRPTEAAPEAVPGKSCPSCFSYNLKYESGCLTCADCGHSNCG